MMVPDNTKKQDQTGSTTDQPFGFVSLYHFVFISKLAAGVVEFIAFCFRQSTVIFVKKMFEIFTH